MFQSQRRWMGPMKKNNQRRIKASCMIKCEYLNLSSLFIKPLLWVLINNYSFMQIHRALVYM
jgi:hypothetical protein